MITMTMTFYDFPSKRRKLLLARGDPCVLSAELSVLHLQQPCYLYFHFKVLGSSTHQHDLDPGAGGRVAVSHFPPPYALPPSLLQS